MFHKKRGFEKVNLIKQILKRIAPKNLFLCILIFSDKKGNSLFSNDLGIL